MRVRAGSSVDLLDDGWAEGAWAGPFDGGGLAQSWMAGSGGRLDGQDLVIRPPGHTLEGIWAVSDGASFSAANSLPLLLAATGLELDDGYPHYLRRFLGVIHGLRRHDITVPTATGPVLHLVTVRDVRISRNLDWSFDPVRPVAPFRDFSHYRASLVDAMARLADNVTSPDRRRGLRPLATLSSGYDSPACAVLAGEVGCREAITISRARDRADRSVVDDSGAHLAGPLGMSVVERERRTELSADGEVVADEFWATGMSGEDIVMRVFDDVLPGSLLVTGFYADTIWSPVRLLSTTLRRIDVAGASMGEMRLRLGFAHVPLPFHGALAHPSIRAITLSAEMDPWRIPGAYDRPIARRILEEHGVDREAFGIAKKATTTVANRRSFDDPVVQQQLRAFSRDRGHDWRTRRRHVMHDVGFRLASPPMRLARPLARKVGLRIDTVRRQSLHGLEGAMAFLWSVDHLRRTRYGHVTVDAG